MPLSISGRVIFSFKRPRHLSDVTVFMKINTIFPARFPSEPLVDGVKNPERHDKEQPSGALVHPEKKHPLVFSWLESERWNDVISHICDSDSQSLDSSPDPGRRLFRMQYNMFWECKSTMQWIVCLLPSKNVLFLSIKCQVFCKLKEIYIFMANHQSWPKI